MAAHEDALVARSQMTATRSKSTASTMMRCRRRRNSGTPWQRAGEVHRHEDGRREPRRGALHGRRPRAAAARSQLDFVQPRRHLGREHVRRRRRRDSAEQDHLEAQHPVRAEHEGAGPRREDQEAAGEERLRRRRRQAHRRRAVARRQAGRRPAGRAGSRARHHAGAVHAPEGDRER